MKPLDQVVAEIEREASVGKRYGDEKIELWTDTTDFERLCAAFRAAEEMKAEWFKYHAAEYDFDMDDNTPEQAKAKMAEMAECMKRFHKAAAAWDAACKGDE